MNITDLIQERLGSSIYTTILAQYAGIPERLLQWYGNGRPVGPTNNVFNVKYDGLNSYLRFKHDVNQTYGTFMLKVNGTKVKDILKLPHPQQIPNLLGSPKAFINKVVTKVINGNILSDLKTSKSDASPNQFLSQNHYNPTSTKLRPKKIHDKTQQTKLKDHYVRQDSTFSSQQQTDSGIRDRNDVTSFVPKKTNSLTTPLNLCKLK